MLILHYELILVIHFLVQTVDEVSVNLFLHIAHGILLLGILLDFRNPGTACLDVVLVDAVGILQGNLGDVVVVADHLVGPCPLIFAIVGINLLEAADELLDGFYGAILQVSDDALFLANRTQES